jgi:hypothetical protein
MRMEMRFTINSAKQALALALCGMLTSMPLNAAPKDDAPTRTPIKHLVVIFQETVLSTSISPPILLLPTDQARLRSTRGRTLQP